MRVEIDKINWFAVPEAEIEMRQFLEVSNDLIILFFVLFSFFFSTFYRMLMWYKMKNNT